ncbi:21497_t:CDS:2 [Gigaspora margarita]|uniref:21497_t:CDS:1 n=1 Tax=Gigaspora margarita TaxID=4874 RepID=A0ABN7VI84_GIGMA|nr:21497_t:CDS:2 [Gigaspora margarita]
MLSQNKPVALLSKASKRNLRKKDLRSIKKAKFENPDISAFVGDNANFTSNINLVDEREDIFYDPLKHKTQSETRLSTKTQTQEYIRSYWESEDFVTSDLNELYNCDTIINSERSLSPQTTQAIHPILTTFQIPTEFIDLLESEIFDHVKPTNKNSDLAWKQFALWAFFATTPSIVKQIRNHCQCLWSKVKRAHQQCIKAKKVSLEQTIISEALSRNLEDKQIIASLLTNKMAEEDINIKGYHHVFDSQRFKNALGETM